MNAEAFEFDAERFMWARRGVGFEPTRYYLTGVRAEPRPEGGALLIATDGRVLFVASDPSAECPRAATLDLQLCEAIAAPEAFEDDDDDCAGPLPGSWSFTGQRLRFSLTPAEEPEGEPVPATAPAVASFHLGVGPWCSQAVVREVGGKFPDWRKVVNLSHSRQPGLPVLSAGLIARAAIVQHGPQSGVVILQRGAATGGGREPMKAEPAVILPVGAPWACVVLMPMAFPAADVLPQGALARDLIAPADLAALMEGAAP